MLLPINGLWSYLLIPTAFIEFGFKDGADVVLFNCSVMLLILLPIAPLSSSGIWSWCFFFSGMNSSSPLMRRYPILPRFLLKLHGFCLSVLQGAPSEYFLEKMPLDGAFWRLVSWSYVMVDEGWSPRKESSHLSKLTSTSLVLSSLYSLLILSLNILSVYSTY